MTYPKGERDIKIVVGENITRYWEQSESEMTFTDFTDQCGISNTTYLREIMCGEVNITINRLQKIASVLKVSTIDLIEDWND